MRWRRQQALDYSRLFHFASHLPAQLYLNIEDDVETSKALIPSLDALVREQNNSAWSLIELAEHGFIGKLLRTDELEQLSALVRLFYARLPVDGFLTPWRLLQHQEKRRQMRVSLFQHRGVNSTLSGKQQLLKERLFYRGSKAESGPSAVSASSDIFLSTRRGPD